MWLNSQEGFSLTDGSARQKTGRRQGGVSQKRNGDAQQRSRLAWHYDRHRVKLGNESPGGAQERCSLSMDNATLCRSAAGRVVLLFRVGGAARTRSRHPWHGGRATLLYTALRRTDYGASERVDRPQTEGDHQRQGKPAPPERSLTFHRTDTKSYSGYSPARPLSIENSLNHSLRVDAVFPNATGCCTLSPTGASRGFISQPHLCSAHCVSDFLENKIHKLLIGNN